MKVLLLYQFLNHTSTVSALAEHLKPHGIDVDCLDLPNLNFLSGKRGNYSFLRRWNTVWMKYGKMRRIVTERIKAFFIIRQLKDYDIVDIHFYSLFYNKVIPAIKRARKPLVIMIWGSDFYRASEKDLEQKRLGFEAADIIHVESECVKADFLKKFPEYERKIYVVQFGLNQLEWIKKAMERPIILTLVGRDIFENKLIVTCGYNGSKGQQHLRMIEAINQQEHTVKQRIHIVIPFTYGGDEEYKNQIISALDKAGVTYTILDKRLSDEQLVELRRLSQIAVNIQVTDSFSASIQENFMAGSVQIVGEWLPYEVFYNQGLFAIQTSMDNLCDNIGHVIKNFDDCALKCKRNKEIAYQFSSWEYVLPKWAKLYNALLTSK